jgi:hypothetical protein
MLGRRSLSGMALLTEETAPDCLESTLAQPFRLVAGDDRGVVLDTLVETATQLCDRAVG